MTLYTTAVVNTASAVSISIGNPKAESQLELLPLIPLLEKNALTDTKLSKY
jgi:hypothetical protein